MELLSNTIFSSYNQLVIVGLIIACSQYVYATIGFGSGMIAISLLALFYGDVSVIVPFFMLLCLPTELTVSYQERDKIEVKKIIVFLIFIIPMIIVATYFLTSFSDKRLVLCLGVIIFVLASYYLFFEDKITISLQPKVWIAITGSLSGLLGGLYGVSGPPLIFYFKTLKMDKYHFRVALLSIFLVMTFIRTISYLVFGIFTLEILFSSLICIPFSLFGSYLGSVTHKHIPEMIFRRITSSVLLISGILLIIKNINSL